MISLSYYTNMVLSTSDIEFKKTTIYSSKNDKMKKEAFVISTFDNSLYTKVLSPEFTNIKKNDLYDTKDMMLSLHKCLRDNIIKYGVMGLHMNECLYNELKDKFFAYTKDSDKDEVAFIDLGRFYTSPTSFQYVTLYLNFVNNKIYILSWRISDSATKKPMGMFKIASSIKDLDKLVLERYEKRIKGKWLEKALEESHLNSWSNPDVERINELKEEFLGDATGAVLQYISNNSQKKLDEMINNIEETHPEILIDKAPECIDLKVSYIKHLIDMEKYRGKHFEDNVFCELFKSMLNERN